MTSACQLDFLEPICLLIAPCSNLCVSVHLLGSQDCQCHCGLCVLVKLTSPSVVVAQYIILYIYRGECDYQFCLIFDKMNLYIGYQIEALFNFSLLAHFTKELYIYRGLCYFNVLCLSTDLMSCECGGRCLGFLLSQAVL